MMELPRHLREQALRNAKWHGESSEPISRPWSVVHYDPIKEPTMTTETWNNTVELGTPVYAIDERQNTVRGVFSKRLTDGCVEILTENGPRVFHARFVIVDQWRALENLP